MAMHCYATIDDMINAFGERECIALTDRDYQNVINESVMHAKLEQASAEIDSYLVGRYNIPFLDSPHILVRRCCDITRFLLTGAETQNTDEIRERYQDAIRFLERVADGRISLGRLRDGSVAKTTSSATRIVSAGTVFNRNNTRNGAF